MARLTMVIAWANFGVWVGPVLVIAGVRTYPSYEMFVLMLGIYCLLCYNALMTMYDVIYPELISPGALDGI
jgi:hypothetical protein